MANGYHQVNLDPLDCEKTAFSTHTGHYEFLRMPQGLKGAPATFQRLMNMVLSGLIGIKCLVYLDDIIVYGVNLLDHNKKLVEVFECLQKNKLKLNPNKCNFLHKEISFLGHIVSSLGVKPDPKKVDAILNFPVPKTSKQIQSFVGLAGYYRRFIPSFSHVASPLFNLLKKGVDFKWDAFCDEAFNKLRQALTTSPILQYPNYDKEFHITCDASDLAIGSVLSQETDKIELPIAYASRTINKAEKNYSTVEKELLSIVWSIEQFRPYIFGRHFTVFTDHKPLHWLWNIKNPHSRLMRWRLKLEQFDFDIRYTPGKTNFVADALSRIELDNKITVITRSRSKNDENFVFEDSESEISEDENETNRDSKNLNENDKIVALNSENDIMSAIAEFHDAPLGGHQGVSRTFYRMKNYFSFPNMLRRIKEYIKSCTKCQINKPGKITKMPMVITSTASQPFEKISLDIVGPINPPTFNNNSYILTMQDELTKYSIATPLQNQNSETISRAFVEQFVCIYGIPDYILTDQGGNFLSELLTSVTKLLKIKKLRTSAYHPQTNGALERTHFTLSNYLKNYALEHKQDWDTWIPYAMFCFNTTPHSTTKFMPYELLFGHKPVIPTSFSKTPDPLYNYEDYVKELKYKMQQTYKKVKENILNAKEISKNYYDKKINPEKFLKGELVLLKNENKKGKLAPLWLGPFEIESILSDENSVIRQGRTLKTIHNNRLKRFIERKNNK